ncbi:MAG TPA: TonB-dependent receptor [Panacibacter sp.]|nr:TonB-dependent receptor [Panacibacter sp.]HNP45179.1 TonB-dependent receptor [Panacibacter sp.]
MKKILQIAVFFCCQLAVAQQHFTAIVQDAETKQALAGVSVTVEGNKKRSAISDANGVLQLLIETNGKLVIHLSYVGYADKQFTAQLPDTTTFIIQMQKEAAALQNVTVVASTRSNESIETSTTKVEVLGLEEMNEESTVKPGNIASILGDMSGIQIQQSSATSGNANVRIQGLDGKYTQILRDGMPLYEGYSGGFGILSIPPLDLKQIELIKGSASTLYGGGAIGGLINLISKKPSYQPDASVLINTTTLKETNVNAYYAQRWKHIGFTLFAGETLQKPVDVNDDGLSDVPDIKATLIHPTLYIYPSNKSSISLSWSGSFENRAGGDMIAIEDRHNASHPYYEANQLNRNTLTLIAENRFNTKVSSTLKASYSAFKREETTNSYFFSGTQKNFYSEASLLLRQGHHSVVAGVNLTADDFQPSDVTPAPVGSFSNTTAGVFVQDTWNMFSQTKLETGIRFDHHTDYGNFVLPRVAVFHHFNEHWGSRLGFGMGYKTPNPLTPQIKDYQVYQLQPIAPGVTAEQSLGANIEFNYKKEFGDGNSYFINHAFFLTNINDPVIAEEAANGDVYFYNESKAIVTKGFDTYVQAAVKSWEFYLGYTYTDAERKYLERNQFMLLTPRNRAAAVVAYAIEGKWRFGLEGSYTGYQYREDFSKTPGYLFMAAMIEKEFGPKWSLVLNCENLLDERQSKYESLYIGSIKNPDFKPLWAPIDGIVANMSLRLRPFAK